MLKDIQIKILQTINQRKSEQKQISEVLDLDNEIVGYYLKNLIDNDFIKCTKYFSATGADSLQYMGCRLTDKGKVAVKNPKMSLKEEKANSVRNIYMGNGNYNERIEGDYIQGNDSEKQYLREAVAEIQKLLLQLEKSNPKATEDEKEAFISAGLAKQKKVRLINALIEGGKGAIEEFINNPYTRIVIKIIEGWKDS